MNLISFQLIRRNVKENNGQSTSDLLLKHQTFLSKYQTWC